MWLPTYNFLNYCLMARAVAPLHPFVLKTFTKELTIVEIIFLYATVSFLISTLLFLAVHDHSRNKMLFNKIKEGRIAVLLLLLAIIFLITNGIKLFIYKHEDIVRARPTLTAIGLIATFIWGIFIFKEKITKKIVVASVLLLLAICILAS